MYLLDSQDGRCSRYKQSCQHYTMLHMYAHINTLYIVHVDCIIYRTIQWHHQWDGCGILLYQYTHPYTGSFVDYLVHQGVNHSKHTLLHNCHNYSGDENHLDLSGASLRQVKICEISKCIWVNHGKILCD